MQNLCCRNVRNVNFPKIFAEKFAFTYIRCRLFANCLARASRPITSMTSSEFFAVDSCFCTLPDFCKSCRYLCAMKQNKQIMTQFERLQEKVDAAIAALPYALNEEQNMRLQNELQAIRDYRRAEMLNAIAEIVKENRDRQEYPTLCASEGYCVSYVCWLLGISDFNPLDHPWLISERFALNTFKKENDITMYYDTETDWESVMTRLYGSKAVGQCHECKVDTEDSEDGQCFKIHVYYFRQSHIYQIEQLIRERVDPSFNSADVPLDDEETFKLLNSYDWMGIKGDSPFNPRFIEAVRCIHPTTFSEFVHTWAIQKTSILNIDIYVHNRDNDVTEYTGVPAVDEVLRQSNGVLLYTRQEEAIKEMVKDLTSEEMWHVKMLLEDNNAVQKCSVYTEAIDVYRRAYMKAHYPEIFRQVFIATEDW